MGIAGLQKFALFFVLFIGFFLGYFTNGVVATVGKLAAGLTPQASPAVAQQHSGSTVKVGNSIIFSP